MSFEITPGRQGPQCALGRIEGQQALADGKAGRLPQELEAAAGAKLGHVGGGDVEQGLDRNAAPCRAM